MDKIIYFVIYIPLNYNISETKDIYKPLSTLIENTYGNSVNYKLLFMPTYSHNKILDTTVYCFYTNLHKKELEKINIKNININTLYNYKVLCKHMDTIIDQGHFKNDSSFNNIVRLLKLIEVID